MDGLDGFSMVCCRYPLGGLIVLCCKEDVGVLRKAFPIKVESFEAVGVIDDAIEKEKNVGA